jgi:hypothetical protein
MTQKQQVRWYPGGSAQKKRQALGRARNVRRYAGPSERGRLSKEYWLFTPRLERREARGPHTSLGLELPEALDVEAAFVFTVRSP